MSVHACPSETAPRAMRARQVREYAADAAKKEVIWCMTLREDAQVACIATDWPDAKQLTRDCSVTEPTDARVLVRCVKWSAANPCPASAREARRD